MKKFLAKIVAPPVLTLATWVLWPTRFLGWCGTVDRPITLKAGQIVPWYAYLRWPFHMKVEFMVDVEMWFDPSDGQQWIACTRPIRAGEFIIGVNQDKAMGRGEFGYLRGAPTSIHNGPSNGQGAALKWTLGDALPEGGMA